MESWSIKELKQWLKTFDNSNSSMSYFLGGASKEDILKARELLKEKLALKGVVTT